MITFLQVIMVNSTYRALIEMISELLGYHLNYWDIIAAPKCGKPDKTVVVWLQKKAQQKENLEPIGDRQKTFNKLSSQSPKCFKLYYQSHLTAGKPHKPHKQRRKRYWRSACALKSKKLPMSRKWDLKDCQNFRFNWLQYSHIFTDSRILRKLASEWQKPQVPFNKLKLRSFHMSTNF